MSTVIDYAVEPIFDYNADGKKVVGYVLGAERVGDSLRWFLYDVGDDSFFMERQVKYKPIPGAPTKLAPYVTAVAGTVNSIIGVMGRGISRERRFARTMAETFGP